MHLADMLQRLADQIDQRRVGMIALDPEFRPERIDRQHDLQIVGRQIIDRLSRLRIAAEKAALDLEETMLKLELGRFFHRRC